MNPTHDDFILNPIIDFFNFDNYKNKKGFWYYLVHIFIPEEDYFSNVKETLLSDLEEALPYNDYLDFFNTIYNISTDGQLEDVSINNYQVGDSSISVKKFIDFSYITKYKSTWFSWVRGFTFIFLVIYNLNQFVKFLRGFALADYPTSNNSGGGVNK